MIADIAEQLRGFRFAQPFRPFELQLKDGRRLRVDVPEYVGWSAKADALSYAAEDDSFEHLRLSDVVTVVAVDPAGAGT